MGQEWGVGWAVHVTFDPHSHRVPCPVPAPGGPSHPFPRQPPPQPLPSHHLPSILLTAARQIFEKLKLGRVTCLMCLATLKSKTQAPHWPQRPTPSSLQLPGPTSPRHIPAPSPAFLLQQRTLSPAFTLCPPLPSPPPCPSFLSFQPPPRHHISSPGNPVLPPSLPHVFLPSQTVSASNVTLRLHCFLAHCCLPPGGPAASLSAHRGAWHLIGCPQTHAQWETEA